MDKYFKIEDYFLDNCPTCNYFFNNDHEYTVYKCFYCINIICDNCSFEKYHKEVPVNICEVCK
jgi:hypothetical protein